MKIFLAGAGGVVGRRLTPLLRQAGHDVAGSTRRPEKAAALRALGAQAVVVDVFDAAALTRAVQAAAPQIIIHQLTDLPSAPGTPGYQAGLERNARLRVEGTRNLVAAAKAAGVKRLIAQSLAGAYAPSDRPRLESDPLDLAAGGEWGATVAGVVALEKAVLGAADLAGIVLRYGFFYGPGTWFEAPARPPVLHVDAAAHAALLAVSKGKTGVYNIGEDDGFMSSDKARRELGFDPNFRISPPA